ncbi:LuxR C-terminal-related transcriptional regulator [Pseudomonas sp.]|uniref:LuxR C-terminal-related transcriptional regulator n=1 Tax=Pseudomonas sp. TaxID=306 RepID=UPI0026309D8B|nr:LuxR C-terminal-related transcriptional regulator [Pseudomonas sp.]
MAQGGLAFWHSLDSRDTPKRLIAGLAHSAQASSGKRGFADPFMRWIDECSDVQEAATAWLAEVAMLSVNVLLLLDDVEFLPGETLNQVLTYLLGNTPANLHIALAARPTNALMSSGVLNTFPITRVTASDLRLRPEETLEILSTALGSSCNPEEGISLHELTEGWPLGVQLAAATAHRTGSLQGLLAEGSADVRRYFIDNLIDRQSAEAVHLLVRLANIDLIHPDLCSAVFEDDEMVRQLIRLQDETPILSQVEGGDWMRLHAVAREVLRDRFMLLPAGERQALARKASNWYVTHQFYKEAAEQSFLAGDINIALSLVESTSHQMMARGHSNEILAWFNRLSVDEVKKYPGFWAPVAWGFAMSEQHSLAHPLIKLILDNPDLSPAEHFEADLISATIAGYTDDIDLMAEILARWPAPPPQARVDEAPVYWVVKGFAALHGGKPDQSRLDFWRIAELDKTQAFSPMAYGFADYGVGLSFLWEGRYALAEQHLRPALARAEEHMDRRNPVVCMLAALLAEACWESDQDEGSTALLAGRLVVLERHGLPDALMAAYKVLARVADKKGRQDQALNLLESLQAIGRENSVLRVQAMAHFELVRLHAGHRRGNTAMAISAQLDELLHTNNQHTTGLLDTSLELYCDLARTHACLADDDLVIALRAADSAIKVAEKLKRHGDAIEARLVRAEVLRRQGSHEANRAYDEAMSLATAGGMGRLKRERVVGVHQTPAQTKLASEEKIKESSAALPKESLLLGAGLLTLKEREVLTLLTRSLSNREIARAMDIGEQTVKWHIKNLFNKLDAGSRKHVVARASMLGLTERA